MLNRLNQNSYHGRILVGRFSDSLKQKLLHFICNFESIDTFGTPAIPYISAWNENESKIWYEYVSSRFCKIFGCSPNEVAKEFNRRIVQRSIYKTRQSDSDNFKEVLTRKDIFHNRKQIRREGIKRGSIEAVYKVAVSRHHFIWLKDLATIESFPEDRIFMSRGILFDVTKEMKAEEELKRVEKELTMHRDHLEDLVQDRTRKLWKSQLEMVSRLARAAEFRDGKTGKHITKMSKYCAVLGKAAGLKRDTNTLLYHASPMHDVGKIGITDKILLKAGRLDQNEFELMKTHCTIGAKLLSGHDSDLLRVARSIALSHHEKWDGSGYPRRLKGRQIPLAGRITAVCDVFDALTSDRPYKKAWHFDQAVQEIKKEEGAHFDPQLVHLFLNNLPAIKQIHFDQ